MQNIIKSQFHDFIKIKKHKGTPISTQSIKIYVSQFNSLLDLFNKANTPKFLLNPDNVLKLLETKITNINTFKLKLNIILMALECFYSKTKNYEEIKKIYNDYLTNVMKIIKEQANSHIPTETQINKALDKQENELIIKGLKQNLRHSIQNNKDLLHLQQYIIYMIFESIPMRGDIATSKFILIKDKHKMSTEENYVILDKVNKEAIYIQVNYKTKKHYKNNDITLPNDLYKYIAKLYNYYNNKLKIKNKYFMYEKDNKTPFNENYLSKFYSNIGLQFINKNISIQVNRVQSVSIDGDSIDILEEKAKKQNHSMNVHTTTYYKRGLKSKQE